MAVERWTDAMLDELASSITELRESIIELRESSQAQRERMEMG